VLTPPNNSDHNILMLADLYEDHGLTNLADEIRSEVLGGTMCDQWSYEYGHLGVGAPIGVDGVGGVSGSVGTSASVGVSGSVGTSASTHVGGSIGGSIGTGVGGLGVRR
jgi:hypothetical protein